MFKVVKEYEPRRIRVRCTEEECDESWIASNNTFPISCGVRHTKATGHVCKVEDHNTYYLTLQEDVSQVSETTAEGD